MPHRNSLGGQTSVRAVEHRRVDALAGVDALPPGTKLRLRSGAAAVVRDGVLLLEPSCVEVDLRVLVGIQYGWLASRRVRVRVRHLVLDRGYSLLSTCCTQVFLQGPIQAAMPVVSW
jgi:hypothetical protein